MRSAGNGRELAERISSAAKGGYCNCPGLLLSLRMGKAPKHLEWGEQPGGFVLLEEHPRFYDLYLCGTFDQPVEVPPREKPILFTHIRGTPPTLAGFHLFRETRRMEIDLASRAAPLPEDMTLAGPADWPELIDLLSLCLFEIDLPSREDFLTEGKETLLLRRDGALAAAITLTPAGRQCMFSSLGVNPSLRKMGLGQAVLRAAIGRAAALGFSRGYDWVNCQNLPSLALHEKVGFHPQERYSSQYLLEPAAEKGRIQRNAEEIERRNHYGKAVGDPGGASSGR